jgi:hypothetical protein
LEKKKIERFILDEFRRLSNDLPPGDIIDGESPDFLLLHAEGVLGVEIEEFVRGQGPRGSSVRKGEEFRDKVAKRSQQLFEKSSSIPIQVVLTWWPRILPKAPVPTDTTERRVSALAEPTTATAVIAWAPAPRTKTTGCSSPTRVRRWHPLGNR